jgi:hypothetical protein
MASKSARAFQCFLSLLVLSLIAPVILRATRVSTSAQNSSTKQDPGSQQEETVPQDSVPQYLPCPDQTKSFKALSDSFASGHHPSQSEFDGAWVLIGLWLHKDSLPDLNCSGIMRGKIFEWVILAEGHKFGVDMAGNYLASKIKADPKGDLTFSIDLQGDSNPVLRCRLTRQDTLVCLGTPYYDGSEYKKMQVNCETPTPDMVALNRGRLCMPYKQ